MTMGAIVQARILRLPHAVRGMVRFGLEVDIRCTRHE